MSSKPNNYIEAVGRRKTAVARVRLSAGSKGLFMVNDRPLTNYFPTLTLQSLVKRPLVAQKMDGAYSVTVKVNGGGIHSQAEAVSHGIARALVVQDAALKPALKKDGLLARDARSKERRKFGLKKARKSPQWSKR
jgi:small subunit ribosomal protein S9